MCTWGIKEYDNWLKLGSPINTEVISLNISYLQITSLEGIDKLVNLTFLNCFCNNLTSLEGIENLQYLTVLNCAHNNLVSLKGIEKLYNLKKLYCYSNELLSLAGIDSLQNLIKLDCSNNKLTSLNEIKNLSNILYINCVNNNLTSLVGIEELYNLKELLCYCNKITSLINFTNFQYLAKLSCSFNKLTSLEGIQGLFNLTYLDCSNCEITSLEEIENLQNLIVIHYNNNPIEHIPPNILRRLGTIGKIQNIYGDSQNVHNHEIQESLRISIKNILNCKPVIMNVIDNILIDQILTEETKRLLIEYQNCNDVHSTLNITFGELLVYVFNRIEINDHRDEIKRILNIEMNDSICKCFTGRISRLINCLNGFDDLVNIKIADSEQISQIIITIKNKLEKENIYDIELHKQLVSNELKNMKYDDDIIQEWIQNIE